MAVFTDAYFVYTLSSDWDGSEPDLRTIPNHAIVPYGDPDPPPAFVTSTATGLMPATEYAFQVIGNYEGGGERLGQILLFQTTQSATDDPLPDALIGDHLGLIFDKYAKPGSTVRLYLRVSDGNGRPRTPLQVPYMLIQSSPECNYQLLHQEQMRNCVDGTKSVNGSLYYYDFNVPNLPKRTHYNILGIELLLAQEIREVQDNLRVREGPREPDVSLIAGITHADSSNTRNHLQPGEKPRIVAFAINDSTSGMVELDDTPAPRACLLRRYNDTIQYWDETQGANGTWREADMDGPTRYYSMSQTVAGHYEYEMTKSPITSEASNLFVIVKAYIGGVGYSAHQLREVTGDANPHISYGFDAVGTFVGLHYR